MNTGNEHRAMIDVHGAPSLGPRDNVLLNVSWISCAEAQVGDEDH